MKQLIKDLKQKTNALDNLKEKDANVYIDVIVPESHDDTINEIANDLTRKFWKFNFPDDAEPYFHPFIHCNESLSKEIGIDFIILCPYAGQIHNDWLCSNYMWTNIGGNNSLFIDIYNSVFFDDEEEFKIQILQELYNFKRDAEFVIEDIYEDKMKEFEIFMNEILI